MPISSPRPQPPAGHRALTLHSCSRVPDASHPPSHSASDTKSGLKTTTVGRGSSGGALLLWGGEGGDLFELQSLLPKFTQLKGSPCEGTFRQRERLARCSSRAATTGPGQRFPGQDGPRIQDNVKPLGEPGGTAPEALDSLRNSARSRSAHLPLSSQRSPLATPRRPPRSCCYANWTTLPRMP